MAGCGERPRAVPWVVSCANLCTQCIVFFEINWIQNIWCAGTQCIMFFETKWIQNIWCAGEDTFRLCFILSLPGLASSFPQCQNFRKGQFSIFPGVCTPTNLCKHIFSLGEAMFPKRRFHTFIVQKVKQVQKTKFEIEISWIYSILVSISKSCELMCRVLRMSCVQ